MGDAHNSRSFITWGLFAPILQPHGFSFTHPRLNQFTDGWNNYSRSWFLHLSCKIHPSTFRNSSATQLRSSLKGIVLKIPWRSATSWILSYLRQWSSWGCLWAGKYCRTSIILDLTYTCSQWWIKPVGGGLYTIRNVGTHYWARVYGEVVSMSTYVSDVHLRNQNTEKLPSFP